MSSDVKQAESAKGADELSTSDGTQIQIELAASRRLLLLFSIAICFITISLLLGGPERSVVGALMPGSQEWLHYNFFHLPRGRG